MTTEVKCGPCATDRCEKHNRPIIEESDGECGQPHQHTSECSARFYREFFGCDVRIVTDSLNVEGYQGLWCARPAAYNHPLSAANEGSHEIPDILGSPESDASWLAMRDVLRECERRTWIWVIDQWSGDSIMVQTAGLDRTRTFVGAIAALPRAVALAAWQATRE